MSKNSYAIIGSGAIGSYYGAKLQAAGFDVHYLLHRSYELVSEQGLNIQAPSEAIKCPKIQAYSRTQDMPSCDVLIIALKTTQNFLLPELLAPILKNSPTILMLQNGLGPEELVSQFVPAECPILCGLSTIGASVVSPGIISVKHEGLLKLSAYQPAPATHKKLQEIGSDFIKTGLQVLVTDDYLLARWQKLAWNMVFNGLSVIYKISADEVIYQHLDLVLKIFEEIKNIAGAYGKILTPDHFENLLQGTLKSPGYKPSMLLDYEHSKPLELEYIYENPIKAAKNKGVACPEITHIFEQLSRL